MHDNIPLPSATALAARLPKVRDPLRDSLLAKFAFAVAERFGLGMEYMPAPLPPRGWEFVVMIGTAKVRLCVDDAGMTWLAPRFFDLAEDYPADPLLLPLVFEAAAGDGFSAAEALLDAPLRVEGLIPDRHYDPQRDAPPDLSILLVEGGTRTPLWIWADDIARLPQLQGKLRAIARQPLRFRATLGSRYLPLRHLRELRPGDVIVSDSPFTRRQRSATLWISAELALDAIQTNEDQIMIEKKRPLTAPPVRSVSLDQDEELHSLIDDDEASQDFSDEDVEPVDSAASEEPLEAGASPPAEPEDRAGIGSRLLAASDVDSLSVRIDIDVGAVEMTVRELRDLAPGAVLQIGRPLDAPALLTANGKLIATADLVDINGRLGARIRTLTR